MPADRLLNTVLQHLQDVHDDAKTDQIIGTTTHLLTQLANPLNLGVLTSQLLASPALWQRPDGLRTALRVVGIYSTASRRVHDNELENRGNRAAPRQGGGVRCDDWARAVVQGADDKSRRWQHLLVLAGVLVGMEGGDRQALSRSLRNKLETAVVTAANLSLDSYMQDGALAGVSIVMGVNYALPLLSDWHKSQLNGDALLSLAMWAMTGSEGFHGAQILDDINRDTSETAQHTLLWSSQSPSFRLLQDLDTRPLMANMGPVAKLTAFAVHQAADTRSVVRAQDILMEFSYRVMDAWRRNKFSEVQPANEVSALSPETLQTTWPAMWQFLRKLLFASVVVLEAIVSRSLLDPHMLVDKTASDTALKSLHILRHLSFISLRNGNDAFAAYRFAYLTSIDVLSRGSAACDSFLQAAQTMVSDPAQANFMQRTLDLFYLNVAEHLPLAMSTEACDQLIIRPASAYLSLEGPMPADMMANFESAHSAVLSVLSCPQHSALTIRMAPFYIAKLFESFPSQISSRQFRVAFRTVMQIVSPPFPIAAMEPHLSETLLEMLRSQILGAGTSPLPATPDVLPSSAAAEDSGAAQSEQSALTLTLVESMPFLPLPLVEEWLTVAAQSLNEIADPALREPVKKRFQEHLVNGELDVDRAGIAVAWWGTKGGRELVLFGASPVHAMMSGALGGPEFSSKL
ncbi:peroxisomal membrane protein Pex17 [Stachybotrys elegans]|uniref:Peroxisomal membrane protein Pex17 n=1 Tax=Stachybotrys elegans TaxID=80388 RepID=A0A8K0T7K9_9HYPO|nr:peroxisomal membrane protein Pex17 [Stachybotrys elegans]